MATITSAQIYDARYDLPDGAGTATPFHPLRSDPKAASRPSRQKQILSSYYLLIHIPTDLLFSEWLLENIKSPGEKASLR